ncbi:hypothetical protein HK102_004371 [Quaeritorhiza haematococci]|nr:hypothetical protein HK102_004371 [Quaeritorhiza haematococci]
MQLRHHKTLITAADVPSRVTAIAWSPNGQKIALVGSDRVVQIFDETGERRDRFSTKPGDPQKVRLGNLKTNKAATLYQTESCVISAASSPDGNAIITGHADGSINRFFFDDGVSGASQGRFTVHKSAPAALAWGASIVAAGSDRTVVFYDNEGRPMQEFDYSRDDDEQDFTVGEFSPSGQSVILGNFDSARGQWEEAPLKVIDNFYTVSSLTWKPDGSRLVAASMMGAVEMFDYCLRRSRYKGKFEFTYVSPSQVIVKRLSTGSRIVLKSHYGYEVSKINIFQDQFLIASTPETLLMGDLASCKLSEVGSEPTGIMF